MDPTKSRGFLNNNPGNIDREAPPYWNGEIRDVNDQRLTAFQRIELLSGRFCVFDAPLHGLRALAKDLLACSARLGDHTVEQFISHWAPPQENDTVSYVETVCRELGVMAEATIDITRRPTMRALIEAIVHVECGGQPYDAALIEQAMTAAGIAP